MARSTSKKIRIGNEGLAITLHSLISEDQVLNWQAIFDDLGAERFPRAFQFSVNRVASDAHHYQGEAIDRPVEFTRAAKGRRSSSIQTKGRSLNKTSDFLKLNQVRSTVFVRDRQSAYFKFLLGETTRLPDDVGPSEDHISTPMRRNLSELRGIELTKHGNMPVHMLATLKRRQRQHSRHAVH